ncbi:VOC family protein [Legionella cardiaca]|uniref:VOC family protein n=1 Tax=Legionella cardiaca TaxID=1071983 RepID=A0ABY8AVL2_9GAMM|nr:VOC family protein [Legionella cardiaca]WED44201.1 VOC family protein [Legionella cardiaca]
MNEEISYLPEGYATITPYLVVTDGVKAIEFYKNVFGAKEVMRMESPDKRVGHAELTIGESKFMLADECPESNAKSPKAFGGSPVGIHLYVKDVDATAEKAVNHGAKIVRKIENQFYGDRSGSLEDPFGHTWHIATHIEDVSEEEMSKRLQKLCE